MADTRCPTCNRRFEMDTTEAMPFCSERCRQIDLGRWLNEENSLPAERIPDEFEEETAEGPE